MKIRQLSGLLLVLTGLLQLAPSSFGFALLGPYAPWMEQTNGLRQESMFDDFYGWQPEDIGGPMGISSEYRWNVPVVTYGFDQSFLDYFGTNGVAAVEQAIEMLNDLPPASDIVPTNYSSNTWRVNYHAADLGLYDLKSTTLSLLLEQMGLAQPTRYIFFLKGWNSSLFNYDRGLFLVLLYPDGTEDDYYGCDPGTNLIRFVAKRNFDPETLAWSSFVNGIQHGAAVWSFSNNWSGITSYVEPYPVNPETSIYTAVADRSWIPGEYYTGLTYDDVGGLRYLLSADNLNYEKLLPDVRTVRPRRSWTGTGAWRPGVEKITFVRQPVDSRTGRFRPLLYRFTDLCLKNDVLIRQPAVRAIHQPDILFCAADTWENNCGFSPWIVRTGTTNWQNNAFGNSNTNGEGPGVIQPPIRINFHKLGTYVSTYDNAFQDARFNIYWQSWASFDDSTNQPVVYPSNAYSGQNRLIIHFQFTDTSSAMSSALTNATWQLPVPIGGLVTLQISTNQVDWTPIVYVVNSGSVIEWWHWGTNTPPKFFRAVPL